MTNNKQDFFVKVIIDRPGLGMLDYRVTHDLLVAIGDRVLVPLGKQKLVGLVVELAATTEVPLKKIRTIYRVLNDIAPLSKEWLDLTKFTAQYYLRSWGETAIPALPLFFRKVPGVRYQNSLEKLRLEKKINPKKSLERPMLTSLQQRVVDEFLTEHKPQTHLLFGVTGSGKTEIYLQLIEKILNEEPTGQVLLLVPEINLTPQLEQRVRSRFPQEEVVCLHSEYSETQRAKSWLSIHEGRARVLVGTRMAIFASFKNLKLIVVDEEHDQSYKAGDGCRFSARDLAIWRAYKNRCSVMLGSATPSLETWKKAKEGKYKLLTLMERAAKKVILPEVLIESCTDMKYDAVFTPSTLHQMRQTIAQGRQVLVFLNRRGYSATLSCPSCHWVSSCKRCSTFTVFHKKEKKLICHHCGYQERVPVACPNCGNLDILPRGIGTERVEEVLTSLFSEQKILRIDRDCMKKKSETKLAFEKVHRGEIDILVGTQMISKGHDFQNIGLVVVLNADAQLMSPEVRAKEQLFQTLMQVAGRAGRSGEQGKVIIQTKFPTDPIFALLREQNYGEFANQLIEQRSSDDCVPFVYQALLSCEANSLDEAMSFLQKLVEKSDLISEGQACVFDAVPMSLVRLNNKERAQVLVESHSRSDLNRFLRQWLSNITLPSNVRWWIDIDPIAV